MQKLAPGSRWSDDVAINADGTEISVEDRRVMFCDKCGESTVDVTDTLAVIDRANLDPVRVAARRLTHELRRNLDAIRFAVPNAHYDNILDNLKELEAVL